MFRVIPKNDYQFAKVSAPQGGDCLIAVPLAQESGCNRVSYLTCGLGAFELNGQSAHDFYFQIDVIDHDGAQESFSTQEAETARPFIPNDIRGKVMPMVCEGLCALATDVAVGTLFFVAKGQNLPEKALAKYQMLTEAAENVGYSVQSTGTDNTGRRYWVLSKSAN